MVREIHRDLKLDSTDRTDTVQVISQSLSGNLEKVVCAGNDYSSFVLTGGAGFGDFDLQSSDVDVWLIMQDLAPAERLQKAKELNASFEIAKEAAVKGGVLGTHNFRHPPTFLTEAESVGYRKAFAAKVGLPVSLGVFPTLLGNERKGEVCFSEEQLIQDLAYSCGVFQENLLNPPKNSIEDPLRYCYKRATYFLRFKLLYDKGLYVPRQESLLSAGEQNLPEWKSVMPMVWQVHDPSSKKPELTKFQDEVNGAMQIGMNKFKEDGVVNVISKTKGDVRTRIFWTLEKLRWDFLLSQTGDEVLVGTGGADDRRRWGFSYSQIDELFSNFFEIVPDESIMTSWGEFKRQHDQVTDKQASVELKGYYDEVYHPKLVSVFDKIVTQTDQLF